MTESVFVLSMAVMAGVVFVLRAAGLFLGSWLASTPGLRRFLEFLPACAIGAAVGPQLVNATALQLLSVVISVVLFAISGRLFFSFAMGTLLLLSGGS